jgi:N-acetylglucosaminyldiphosphoundecaprenol N-acetyl-beta-D-mannosaminyltransferase
MHKVQLNGLPVTTATGNEPILAALKRSLVERTSLLMTFVNPHAWRIEEETGEHARLLRQFDMVLPDGIGVVHLLRRLHDSSAGRFSFDATSLYPPVLATLQEAGASLFVVGAKPGVAERAVARMRAAFPGVDFLAARDGYRDWAELEREILDRRPTVVLCGMGAPHQERFMLRLKAAGYAGVMISCGGFLDQLAEAERYYPAWIDRHDLRWLYRVYKEPRRLWRRYAVDYLPFLRFAFAALARQRLLGPGLPLPIEPSDQRN